MTQSYYSLKQRLLIRISIPVLIAGLLISLLSFLFSWHEITEVYDAQMAHTAHVLIDLTENDIHENGARVKYSGDERADIQHRYERKTGYRLWHKDELMIESFKTKEFGNLQAPPGFSDQDISGKPWRFFVYMDPVNNVTVEISQRYAIRYELIGQLMMSLLIPALLFIPILLGVIWFVTGRSLQPLIALSHAVDTRHSDDLTPIAATNTPREIMPLVQATNRLFSRIQDSFVREREFTDHAAHELRTPLAAMKTQTQVLMKKSANMPDCQDGFENLNATIDRSTRLIEQLLQLARVQNEKFSVSRMNISECVTEVLEGLLLSSRGKHQVINQHVEDEVYIEGHAESLLILIRNLLDNAVKYTPEGGVIDISLTRDALLTVKDTGPGLSDTNKQNVFHRFFRADKTGQSGSGLGLSIAQWIAEAHHTKIILGDHQPQGLIVEVKWEPCA